jgi:hypothetical protein
LSQRVLFHLTGRKEHYILSALIEVVALKNGQNGKFPNSTCGFEGEVMGNFKQD